MQRPLIFALCLLLCLLPSMAAAADGIDAQADDLFAQYNTVGGALVVVKDGAIVYQRYYGYQDAQSKTLPVTPDTYFRLASVTKMVSSIG